MGYGRKWMGYGRTWPKKEIVIIASFDHFSQVTNKLDLFLPARFPFHLEPGRFYSRRHNQFSVGVATP